ncbi:MAG: hypothetical protein FJ214_03630 [Ignavibacteria bacterium]|nr:hypothetical protein [Ignavibacteria bacterium]
MDITKSYIVQCITAAANNLRLSSEKIETVAILRERITSCTNILDEIKKFKKTTELSKLGIKLSDIFNYVENGKLDFLKVSENFREHSHLLVRELNHVLDITTPTVMKSIFQRFYDETINIDLTKRGTLEPEFRIEKKEVEFPKRSHADELKEALIFDELNKEEGFNFESYEEKVLRPIKEIDSFLNKVLKYNYTESEITNCIKKMNENAQLSQKVGFDIISNMHKIFADGLESINQKKIAPSVNTIDSLRACLIVIVAVIRGKEVDITNYLTRAENFGKMIKSNKREL